MVNVWWDMDLTSPNIRIYQNILIEMEENSYTTQLVNLWRNVYKNMQQMRLGQTSENPPIICNDTDGLSDSQHIIKKEPRNSN